jgi:hypothetical protein
MIMEEREMKWMRRCIKTMKITPMTLAFLYWLNTILGYIGWSQVFINLFAGVSVIPLIVLFVASYAFRFCGYHRMFLYYIVVSNSFCWLDVLFMFPLSNFCMFAILMVIAGVFLAVILYQWLHSK